MISKSSSTRNAKGDYIHFLTEDNYGENETLGCVSGALLLHNMADGTVEKKQQEVAKYSKRYNHTIIREDPFSNKRTLPRSCSPIFMIGYERNLSGLCQ